MYDTSIFYDDLDTYTITALHSVDCARPPCPQKSRRFRRRGPRSRDAIIRRRQGCSVLLVLVPQGGGPC